MATNVTAGFRKDLYLLISKTYLKFLEDVTPVKSGNMKRHWFLVETEPLVYVITNDAEYAAFLDEGTGIYATKGFENDYKPVMNAKPIVPKTKKALAFKIGSANFVVKSVKGIKALKLLQKANTSSKLKKKFDKGLSKLIEKHLINFLA
jgi:hypothetical protein